MGAERILSVSFKSTESNTAAANQVNTNMENIAKSLGIQISDYYIYDDNGECTGVDYQKLSRAINEAMQKKNASEADKEKGLNQYKNEEDTFETSAKNPDKKVIGAEGTLSAKAKSSKDEIDKEYKNAVMKYSQFIDENAESTSKEGQLAQEWESIQQTENKLTSVTASNTTVIEGVKEFITSLTNLVNETKTYNKSKESNEDKESAISLKTTRDIIDEHNGFEVSAMGTDEENALGNNPFMKSAFETFLYEDEEVAV